MTALFQVLVILTLLAYVALIVMAMRYVRRQNLSERQLIFWDAIILFMPIGMFIPYLYFSRK